MKQNIKKGRYLFYEGEVYDLGGGGDSGEAMAKAEEALAAAQAAQQTADGAATAAGNAQTAADNAQDTADAALAKGLPAGGSSGQVLAKASGTDYDTEWIDPPGWDLLWENAASTSDFSQQDVTVTGLSNYPFVAIAFKTYKADAAVTINLVPYDAGGTRDFPVFAPFITQRVLTWSGDVISFMECWLFRTYNSYTTQTNNGYLVPYKVYGVKQ